MNRRRSQVPMVSLSLAWVISILFTGGGSHAHAAAQQAVSVEVGVEIPMRDGINLAATIYRPKDTQTRLPVVLHFTPYIADRFSDRALYFARRDYVVATVDVRGRGNSEGEFEPFVNEGRDGYDVVEWLASQPWSNGKVTMIGGILHRLGPVERNQRVPATSGDYRSSSLRFSRNGRSAHESKHISFVYHELADYDRRSQCWAEVRPTIPYRQTV